MLRTTLEKSYIKRTVRPLYGWSQATPQDMKLDAGFYDAGVKVFPGMVATKTAGQNVTVVGDAADAPLGLFGLYIGGDDIDEVKDQGVNSVAVWVLGPDAQFEILSPAFDTDATYDDEGETLLHAWVAGADQGKLAPAGSTKAGHTLSTEPVARLVEVVSDSVIIVAGLRLK
jgi:hypothetical protein